MALTKRQEITNADEDVAKSELLYTTDLFLIWKYSGGGPSKIKNKTTI